MSSVGAFLFDFQGARGHIWLNGTKSAGKSVEASPNSSHVLPTGHHIRHSYHHACLIMGYWTRTHACLRDSEPAGTCVSYIPRAIMYLNCTWLTGTSGTVALDQQARLFKLHLASVHVLFLQQTSSPAIIVTGSADIFIILHVLLCSTGPPNMSETKTPDQQLCL